MNGASVTIGWGLAVALVVLVADAFRGEVIDVEAPHGRTDAIGGSLFSHWVLPFEALSVLLLAALVGAIVVSRTRQGQEERR